MATSVRVSEATRERAARLAKAQGTSIGELVDRALDALETRQFWDQAAVALTASPSSDEYDEWDGTAGDGLDRE